MDEVFNINDNSMRDHYIELLARRDQLRKEALIYEDDYLREFGEEMYRLFEEKVRCIELKKKIHFCQTARNHGRAIDMIKMDEYLASEMKEYYEKLQSLLGAVNGAMQAGCTPRHMALEAKQKYRRIAKRIHPDLHPFTIEDAELMDLWNRAKEAYHMNDAVTLDEIEVLVMHRLEELGHGDEEDFEIEDLPGKILKVREEINEILNTDPYQYSVLLMNDELVEEKHKSLKEESDNYQHYREELEAILHTFISEGDVTITWIAD